MQKVLALFFYLIYIIYRKQKGEQHDTQWSSNDR